MIRKDDIVTCPNCKSDIARVLVDLPQGTTLQAGDFEGIQKPLYPDMAAKCDCGTQWYIGGALHIKYRGWVPKPRDQRIR